MLEDKKYIYSGIEMNDVLEEFQTILYNATFPSLLHTSNVLLSLLQDTAYGSKSPSNVVSIALQVFPVMLNYC